MGTAPFASFPYPHTEFASLVSLLLRATQTVFCYLQFDSRLAGWRLDRPSVAVFSYYPPACSALFFFLSLTPRCNPLVNHRLFLFSYSYPFLFLFGNILVHGRGTTPYKPSPEPVTLFVTYLRNLYLPNLFNCTPDQHTPIRQDIGSAQPCCLVVPSSYVSSIFHSSYIGTLQLHTFNSLSAHSKRIDHRILKL